MITVKRSATCSTRGGSQGTYIMFASAMRLRQPALALKPRGDVTRNPKQGYQWPQNRTCVCVRQKYLKKKKKKKKKETVFSTNGKSIHYPTKTQLVWLNDAKRLTNSNIQSRLDLLVLLNLRWPFAFWLKQIKGPGLLRCMGNSL